MHDAERGTIESDGGQSFRTRSAQPGSSSTLARGNRFQLIWLFVLAITGSVAMSFGAGLHEGFEGAETSWRMAGTDCTSFRMMLQERRFADAHGGRACELVQFSAGPGTTIYLTHSIPSAPIIQELIPSVWVKSDRQGIRLLARVVFPRTKGKDGQPLTSLLAGDSYTSPGTWRQLRITDLPQKLHREVWNLRTQSRTSIDEHEAYIDRLVLNVYTEVGGTSVWIDDLELIGFATSGRDSAETTAIASRIPSSMQGPSSSEVQGTPGLINLQGTMLTVGGKPTFVRAVEHQGETMAYLKSLGFDAVIVPSPATESQLAEASRCDLWVITPPPFDAQAMTLQPGHRQVLAWYVDAIHSNNDVRRLDAIEQMVKVYDPERRPILFHTNDRLAIGSDRGIRLFDRSVLGTSCDLFDFGSWLAAMGATGRTDRPMWFAMPTELPAELRAQVARLARSDQVNPQIEYDQLRLLAFEAVARGVRGIWFRSTARLDGQDEASRYRAAMVDAINRELELVLPWAAGGTPLGERVTTHPQIRVFGLQTNTSRLLIVSNHVSDQQFVAAAAPDEPVSFAVHGTPLTDQAYKISSRGVEALPSQRGGGVRVVLDAGQPLALVLMTQDPLAVNYVGRIASEIQPEFAARYIELGETLVAETSRIATELITPTVSLPIDPRIAQARADLRQATQLAERGDPRTATLLMGRAMNTCRRIRRELWESANLSFTSPVASPFCMTFATLPLHRSLAARLAQSTWSVNVLAAGEMENMDHLLSSGWKQERPEVPGVEGDVRLSLEAPAVGRSSLQVRTWRDGSAQSARPDGSIVTISSAPVNVVEGQLLRIHGQAKVPVRLESSSDGLMIYDSQSGLTLAERVQETQGWREFVLYRVAVHSGEFRLVFAHTGFGESWIDDVSITVLERIAPDNK